MSDPDTPLSKPVLPQLKDPQVLAGILRMGRQITGSPEDAEDLAGEAIARVIPPTDFPWLKWTFLTHMMYVMRHLWGRWQRRAHVEREIADEDVTRGKKGFSREPPADDELDRRRWLAVHRQLGERLLAEIGDKDPLVLPCFELSVQGHETPAEQAELLKRPVADVKEAHRLIKYHARRIRTEWEAAEERRMRELRANANRKRRKENS